MSASLYNREILALAVGLADYPRLDAPDWTGELRAPLCGSRVTLDLAFEEGGCIRAVGLKVEACALGQAAATLFARAAVGCSGETVESAHRDMAAWLGGKTDLPPTWPGIAVITPARDYPARHAAILLPFALAAQFAGSVRRDAAA
jgi:NifU-like protein involved in Fe-S cluster formation